MDLSAWGCAEECADRPKARNPWGAGGAVQDPGPQGSRSVDSVKMLGQTGGGETELRSFHDPR
ncbi:hypothetical protein C5708_05620 [Caulobacter sp. CCUG 60055]|nr:hypothetical protein [Caulobacter sp. CCUG 60055]